MNDELSGQLADARYPIPDYAQRCLWLQTEAEAVQVEGPNGLFRLTTPASMLVLRYGHENGPVLTVLKWKPDNLEWDGTVRVGGYVDALHLSDIPGFGAVGLVYLGGQPLDAATSPVLPAKSRRLDSYESPDFYTGIVDDIDETTSMWLVGEDSTLLTMAQDALMNKMRVWFTGRLADHTSGWDRHFALPLLLEAITLFGS
jgi:hypothetical protein